MGFLANPAIIKGAIGIGSSLLGGLFGKKAQSSAQKRSPEEAAALAGAQSSAQNMTTHGNALMGQGTPMLGQAGNYWSTLLSGNRAQMAQATAAPRAALTDIYRGAESNLERSGVRGAQRDVATAELGRDRAGQIARLTTGMQPMAAQQLAGVGSDLLGRGAGLAQGAGSIWGNLLGEGFENRKYAREEGEKASKPMGGLIFDILSGVFKKKLGGAGTPGASFGGAPVPWLNF